MRCSRPPITWAEPKHSTWSTFGPHTIGAERFAAVSSGKSFAQVAGAILRKQVPGQNPDKDEVQVLPTLGSTCGRRGPSPTVLGRPAPDT